MGSDKIKILHLTYDMHIGGTEQVIKNLVEYSDQSMFDITILCLESPPGPFADDLRDKGYKIDSLSRNPGFDWSLIKKIRKYIKQHEIDIIHCHQYTPWVYGTMAAFLTSSKTIFTEHGRFYPDSSTWKRRSINPLLHLMTSYTTAISGATRDALAQYENLPEKDIEVVYNGIAPLTINKHTSDNLRFELSIPDDALCLGTIARLDPIKNHLMMIQAFKQVLNHGIQARLVIVGDGEMSGQINALIKELGLSDFVIMPGYQTNVKDYYGIFDIYLLSSFSEGTSMTLLEAMSVGLPCIVTDAGGNPEIIHNDENGLVTPNDDCDAFATAIVRLAEDTTVRREMSDKSRIRFDKHFSASSMCDRFRDIYKSLVPANKS